MSEEEGSEYELSPPSEPTPPENTKPTPKPGDPDWVPPTPIIEEAEPAPVEPEEVVDPDVQQHRAVAILGYIFFLIPLVAAPNSRFARYHANQGLILFIFWCVAILTIVAMTVGWSLSSDFLWKIWPVWLLLGCVSHLGSVALVIAALALTLAGILNAANGEEQPLPLVGRWTLIK